MANQVFGIRVKELREKAGLSMDQLATKLGVSKSRVNMWENSGTIPRGDVLIQLANYFKVSTDYLLGNDDESAISPTNAQLVLYREIWENLMRLILTELKEC